MSLAVILVIASALALIIIVSVAISRNVQLSRGDHQQVQPIDIDAFRNLVDPSEDEYLRQRLPTSEYRTVQRKRLRAAAVYIQLAARNAAVLALIGQAALTEADSHTVEAARQLVDNSLLLRRNATFALLRVYAALVWPHAGETAAPILHGYERLNGQAMLLGRLQNPSVPLRITASR